MSGIGGVWVPGGSDDPRQNYENALERACSIAVFSDELDAMSVIAVIEGYRSETLEQIRAHPDATADVAAEWLDAEDRMELPLPDSECGLFAGLDDATIRALRDDGLSANEVVEVYAGWVERTKREFEATHGLGDGWADVEVDDERWR